ncbi:NADH-quinone oxidoreductase subunit N [Candidatus Poribacteria bacterium]|nr:NADH-quinone oxidoreductase subunit N [Candidatus Poribacteria bacterium]
MNLLSGDLKLVLPEIFISVTAMGILILGTFVRERGRTWLACVTLSALAVTGYYLMTLRSNPFHPAYSSMYAHDGMALVFKMLFIVVGILAVLVSYDFLRTRGIPCAEFFALILFSTVGMMLVASAYDFMLLFVGLELSSLATYILVGLTKKDLWSNEAAIKYFLLSIFASAILLFGISIVYAATGTTNFGEIASRGSDLTTRQPLAAVVALVFLVAAFGFKITAVPFHMYAPDVYQGAPTPVTIFLAVGPKAAAFAGLIRVLGAVHAMSSDWLMLVSALSFLTMTVGNVGAVLQTNVKRMLAYSSIAHAGYALIGVASIAVDDRAGGVFPSSTASVIFYLVAYTIMNVGAFSLLMYMRRDKGFGEDLADFSGLARRRPVVAAAMLIFLLSLAGIPPSIGFLGKFYIFATAVRSGLYWLAVAGVLNAVVSLFYYARIVVYMFMKKQERDVSDVRSFALNLALGASAVATVVLGIFPQTILDVIARATSNIFTGGIIQ